MEKHAPKRVRVKKIRPLNPWFDEKALAAKKERRRCERLWLSTRSETDKDKFKASSIHYNSVLERKKTSFIATKLKTVVLTKGLYFQSLRIFDGKVRNKSYPNMRPRRL